MNTMRAIEESFVHSETPDRGHMRRFSEVKTCSISGNGQGLFE